MITGDVAVVNWGNETRFPAITDLANSFERKCEMLKIKKLLPQIFVVFVALFCLSSCTSLSVSSNNVEREFEIDVTELFFPVLSDEANKKLAQNMMEGIKVLGYYKPDIRKEGVTHETSTYFLKRGGFLDFGIFSYELASHTEEFTKDRGAEIFHTTDGKIRFKLPERVENYFVLSGLYLVLPISGVEGLENLTFDSMDNKGQLVPISFKSAQEGTAFNHYNYMDTANDQKNNHVKMKIQLKAKLKISLVEDNGTRLVAVVEPVNKGKNRIGRAQGGELAGFSEDERGDFASINDNGISPRAIQSPNTASTWLQNKFKTTGVYGKTGRVEVLRIDSGRSAFHIGDNFHDNAAFSIEWIRVGGRVVRADFSHATGSKKFLFGVFFSDNNSKFYYLPNYYRDGYYYTQTVNEVEFGEILENRRKKAETLAEKRFVEHDKFVSSLDRNVFEREFDVYKNFIENGGGESGNADRYEGFLKNGLPDDDEGIIRYRNGDIVAGKFKKGKLLQGALTYGKGKEFVYYEGKFEAGKASNGLIVSSGGSLFMGEFKEGRPYEGLVAYFDENEFENALKRGEVPCEDSEAVSRLIKKVGKAKTPIAAADVHFKDGRIDGHGTIKFEGAKSYRGTFKESKIDTGIFSFSYTSRYMEYENGVLVYRDKKSAKSYIEEQERLLLNTIYCAQKIAN
ncbi:MAG: hypothetical protein LBQ81_03905 [Zoogloeaceae bacterium]|jgi:hypothetical protein|nr:hypothetical protein [Zoogloeaceae bacterium]